MSLGRELEGGQVCHGCLLGGSCLDHNLGRAACEDKGGIWHTENPATALVKGEIAEMKEFCALDTNGDGDISEAEISSMLKAMGEKPSLKAITKLREDVQNKCASSALVEGNQSEKFLFTAAIVAMKGYKLYKAVKVAKTAYKGYKYYKKARRAYKYYKKGRKYYKRAKKAHGYYRRATARRRRSSRRRRKRWWRRSSRRRRKRW